MTLDPDYSDEEQKVCSICQRNYTGWGNNPYPVNNGRCCNDCNEQVVLPARIMMLFRERPRGHS